MPKEALYEMFCDHWSFCWKSDNLREINNWYKENKNKMILHNNTRKLYEEILEKVNKVLDEEEDY